MDNPSAPNTDSREEGTTIDPKDKRQYVTWQEQVGTCITVSFNIAVVYEF